jgi:hypothetical protein
MVLEKNYRTIDGWFFRGELEIKLLKFRITEVTVISNFITNIVRFSESANLFDRNFTVKEVLLLKKGFYLENNYHKTLFVEFFLP